MKLGLFADPHYCTRGVTCGTRRPSMSYGKIEEAMTAFREAGVDLVVCLGDLVDDCGDDAQNEAAAIRLSGMIASFGLPFLSLMGNHDYLNFTRETFDRLTGGAYPPFSAVYGDKTLLFLDANYTDAGEVYTPGNVEWTDTRLPEDQVIRLREALAASADRDVYVFIHQSLDSEVEGHHVVHNADVVRALLEEAGNVRAVIAGHYHPGHDTVIGGIRYHTLPAMCEGGRNAFEILELD